MRRRRHKRSPVWIPIALVALALPLVSFVPLRQHFTENRIRQAMAGLPNREAIVHTLRFDVRDSITLALLPEVSFIINDQQRGDEEPEIHRGDFVCKTSPGADYTRFHISAPGYETWTQTLRLPGRGEETVTIPILLKAGVEQSGRVVDGAGQPVEGALVLLSGVFEDSLESRRSYWAECLTDAAGRWTVRDLPPDCREVEIFLQSSHPVSRKRSKMTLTLPAEEEPVIIMPPGLSFHGRIVDTRGAPVAGAEVTTNRSGEQAFRSDDEGRFTFVYEEPEDLSGTVVTARADGYATRYVLLRGDEDDTFKVELGPGALLRVRLTDVEGRTLAGLPISVTVWATRYDRAETFARTTNAAGELTVEGAPEGAQWSFSVTGSREELYEPTERLSLAPGNVVHTVTVYPPTQVYILAIDASTGEPVEEIHVTPGTVRMVDDRRWWARLLGRQRQQAGVHWNYRVREPATRVFQGRCTSHQRATDPNLRTAFRVDADGYFPTETRLIREGENDAWIVVRLTPGRSTTITVRDAAGAVVKDVRAAWFPVAEEALHFRDGDFSGRNNVQLIRGTQDGTITLPPVDRSTHTLALIAREGCAFLEGTSVTSGDTVVLSPFGAVACAVAPHLQEAYAGGSIRMTRYDTVAGRKAVFIHEAAWNDDGVAQFSQVYPGTYGIGPAFTVHRKWRYDVALRWTDVNVEAGATSGVRLDGGRTVSGQVEVPATIREAFFREHVRVLNCVGNSTGTNTHLAIDDDGTIRGGPLPPDDYVVERSDLWLRDAPDGQHYRYYSDRVSFRVPSGGPHEAPVDLGVITFHP